MLIELPALLTPEDLQTAQALLRAAPWNDGRQSAGTQARQVKKNEQLPRDCEAATQIRQLLLQRLNSSPLFLSAALPNKLFPPHINRYQALGPGEDQYYGPHIDNAIRLLADGQSLRTDVSCTVFLNEPGDYEGGELVVHDTYGQHAVKLPAGHAVLYPGTSLHEVRPVTRGVRWASFFWVQSLVRLDEQRRLLFEMDMNLLRLRSRHGETPETTALTGTYHNLLRLWSQT